MGFEKKTYRMSTGRRMKEGGIRLATAAGAVAVGLMMHDEFKQPNEYGNQSLFQGTINKYQNEYHYSPNSSRIKAYKTAGDIGDFVMDAIPYLLIAAGAASAVSGVSYITNVTYRKD
jgi:hypothetical protein